MKTIKFISIIFISVIFLTSCQFNGNFGMGVKGNGNVQKTDRVISEDFKTIKVSRGLDVYLTQGDQVNITVEADENLQDIIVTVVEGNTLKIYADENISSSKAQKFMLRLKIFRRLFQQAVAMFFQPILLKAKT